MITSTSLNRGLARERGTDIRVIDVVGKVAGYLEILVVAACAQSLVMLFAVFALNSLGLNLRSIVATCSAMWLFLSYSGVNTLRLNINSPLEK